MAMASESRIGPTGGGGFRAFDVLSRPKGARDVSI
jgi:hypothetical protein